MTGRHDIAAAVRVPVAATPPELCCAAWRALQPDQRAAWPWQALHQLAHSPVPFSASTLAELARIPGAEAERLIAHGQHHRWIARIAPARRPALWRGCLPRER
jgi:hypothetical protein